MDRVVFFAMALVAVVGCGSGSKIVPVSGTVTLDGQPLANAFVGFQPQATGGAQAGVGSYGMTDAAGKFTLKTSDKDEAGAVVGTHRVEITVKEVADDRDPKLRPKAKVLPTKYNRETELQFKVEAGGTDAANFDLKSR